MDLPKRGDRAKKARKIALQKFKDGGTAKDEMKCGEVKKSTTKGKKIMKKVCADSKEKLVHAGAKGYKHNYSDEARKNFRARHKCDEKKDKFSAQKVACEELWKKGGRKKTKV